MQISWQAWRWVNLEVQIARQAQRSCGSQDLERRSTPRDLKTPGPHLGLYVFLDPETSPDL